MKNKLFSALLGISMLLVLFGCAVHVAADGDIPVTTRPIPAELADVAEPYVELFMGEAKDVQILLSLPEVQLKSADADAVNNEIAELEQWIVDDYNASYTIWKEDPETNKEYGFYYYSSAHYTARVVKDILSIRIQFFGNLGPETSKNLIYNFDISNGNLLSDEALVNKLTGQTLDFDLLWEENVVREARAQSSVIEAWSQAMSMQNYGEEDYQQKPIVGYADQLTAQSLALTRALHDTFTFDYEKELTTSALSLANNGHLQMDYVQASLACAGYYYTEAPFYPYAYPTERALNPVYVDMMEALGLDPKTSPYNGLLAFVGSATDQAELESVLGKVAAFSARWNSYTSPSPILSTTSSEETDWQEVGTFSEFYLVVPKYQNDFIEMTEVELTEDGQIVSKYEDDYDDPFLDFWSGQAMGAGLVGISTETMPSGVIRFSNIFERGEFWYPSFSGQDGSLILPEDILDVTDLVEENFQSFGDEAPYIDEGLSSYISWNWPKG